MKRSTKTVKVSVAAMLTALSILFPQIFHLTGIPQVGAIFLPMHIPVLMSGFLLGPVYGAIIGLIAPLVSNLLTNMPVASKLPFMMIELFVYGLTSGLFYHKLSLSKKSFGTVIALVMAMVAGRLAYGISMVIAAEFFNIEGGFMVAITSSITGIYGIVLQLVTIPPIVYAVRKAGLLNERP